MNLSRRGFLFASSGAAAGAFAAPGPGAPTGGMDFAASGLVTGKLKPPKWAEAEKRFQAALKSR